MRFSIKLVLAVTAYAAVASASVAYAGDAWAAALSLFGFALVVAAVIAAATLAGTARAFFLGFAVAGLLSHGAIMSDWAATADVRRAVKDAATMVVDLLPRTRAAAPAKQAAETPSYVIQAFDVVGVFVAGTPEPGEIAGQMQVGPDGTVALGPRYGRVQMSGLTRVKAEGVLRRHLSANLTNPEVQVTVVQAASTLAATPNTREQKTVAVMHHVLMFFALLGALLAFWCHHIRTRALAANPSSLEADR